MGNGRIIKPRGASFTDRFNAPVNALESFDQRPFEAAQIFASDHAFIAREDRFKRAMKMASAIEDSGEFDEHEKTIGALLTLVDIAQAVGELRWEMLSRVILVVDSLQCVRSGVKAPLFEPKNPVGGASNPLQNLWRAHCVASVEAARRVDNGRIKDARLRLIKDLEKEVPTAKAAGKLPSLWDLTEWAKTRTMDRWGKSVEARYQMLIRIQDTVDTSAPEDPEKLYKVFLQHTAFLTKQLI